MKKILTIGGAMYDAFLQSDTLLKNESDVLVLPAGKKIEIDAINFYSGGGAVNSAVSFARLGHHVEAFFKVGTDYEGDVICNALEREGVAIPYIIKDENQLTGRSFILPDTHGNLPILSYRGANLALQETEISYASIERADQLYITSLNGPAAPLLLPIVLHAKKHNKPIAANPGTSQLTAEVDTLRSALPHIDILVLNKYEAQLLTKTVEKEFVLEKFFIDMHELGPSIVVVTDGAHGVYVSNGEKVFFKPSIKTDVVSSVGAGDAFSSTFVSFLIMTNDIERALSAGVMNSASVIAHTGAQTGLLTRDELEKRLQNF